MSDPIVQPETDPTEVPAMGANGETDWEAEAAKWKALSRKHETAFKATSKELDTAKTAQLSDTEKALEAAREEGRKAARAEAAPKLAKEALKAEAAKAGTALPDERFINIGSLLTADGEVDGEAVAEFVKSLPSAGKPKAQFSQAAIKGGSTTGSAKPGQLTREDLKGMTHEQINKARSEGRLNALMGIS